MVEWLPRRPAAAEVAVVEALVGRSGDPRADLLVEQFRGARRVERHVDRSSLQVVVAWTTDELLVDLDEDVTSEDVTLHDLRTGQPLRFRVHLARGGFLHCLRGEADGRWPRRWAVAPDELDAAAADGALVLPDRHAGDALTAWLDVGPAASTAVVARAPATASELDAVEGREGRRLPDVVRAFLATANGAVLPEWVVLGTADLCLVDVAGGNHWQVAVGAGAVDDRRALLSPDGTVVVVPAHDAPPGTWQRTGHDLRRWLADQVR